MNGPQRERIKVTIVFSNISKFIRLEWLCETFDRDRFDLSFLILNAGDSEIETWLRERDMSVERIRYRGKKDFPRALAQGYRLLRRWRPDIVHAHLFDATLVAMIAGAAARIPVRVYTRHHSTYHHEYMPKALKWDRVMHICATNIVAISEVVRRVLVDREGVSPSKIALLHHGFRLDEFERVDPVTVEAMKAGYGIATEDFVVGAVSRYIRWKGVHHMVVAFKQFLEDRPEAKFVIANALGTDAPALRRLISEELPADRVVQIEYERDMPSLYAMMDVLLHVPINPEIEAFGQIYVEAMAAGIPSVVTLSGIAHEYIVDGENAVVVNHDSAEAILDGLRRLDADPALRARLVENGRRSVHDRFALDGQMRELASLYERWSA